MLGSKIDIDKSFKLGIKLAKTHKILKNFVPSVSREIDMRVRLENEISFLLKIQFMVKKSGMN